MAAVKMNLRQLRQYAGSTPKLTPKSEYGSTDHVHAPMFLPVDTDGSTVVNVTTRQSFLNHEIGNWKTIHLTRMGGIVLGIAALILYGYNVYLAAVAALAAGYLVGIYARKSFFFYKVLARRELLEGT
ncbi:MAG: hypothetical protein V1834_04675 [Candidatus Micrarchaeota archaeon]